MLGPINRFLLKYPGLGGLPFYVFLLGAIGAAGTTLGGAGLFYTNIFNTAVNNVLPGLGILGEEIALPVVKGIFNLVSGVDILPEANILPSPDL
ncbi:MAG: hypothetical protein KDI46_05580 [Alphaproteobacteria bacterium]|nr:hypothetical protein [Alphaproteobacteria bacterium]